MIIAGRSFRSRLILGTGKYPSFEIMRDCHEVSGTEMVTVAVRRVDLKDRSKSSLLDFIDRSKIRLLPNTAGCYTADDAVRTAKLGREAFETDWVKLEVIGDDRTLMPDPVELVPAAETLVDEGDEVLMADPYYATYESVIAAAGGVAAPIRVDPDHGFHLKAADLERAITPRSRVLLMNTPSNPTGAVFTRAEIERIGKVCEKHDLWIISDEVYATLTYGNTVFSSPFDMAELERRTVVVSSLSKSHAMPGFRCGWIAASSEFCEKANPVTEAMLFGSQPFIEDAAAFALDSQFPELDVMKKTYEARARALVAELAGAKKVRARMPEGGMFVMIDIRKTGVSGEEFARRLLAEENVVTMPGESFGAGGSGHLRAALTVDESDIREACRRIVRLSERV